MSNFVSLYGALIVDGMLQPPAQHFTSDLDALKIMYVVPGIANDYLGNPTSGFYVICENPNSIKPLEVFMYQTPTLTTIAQFATGLNTTLGTDFNFTTYTNLVQIDYLDVPTSSVLINDFYVAEGRTFDPQSNTTIIQVKSANFLVNKKFTVQGQQTLAGAYTYFP